MPTDWNDREEMGECELRSVFGTYHDDVDDGDGVQFDVPQVHDAEHVDDDHEHAQDDEKRRVYVEAEQDARDEKDSGERRG